jgi:hypothetical protein
MPLILTADTRRTGLEIRTLVDQSLGICAC